MQNGRNGTNGCLACVSLAEEEALKLWGTCGISTAQADEMPNIKVKANTVGRCNEGLCCVHVACGSKVQGRLARKAHAISPKL